MKLAVISTVFATLLLLLSTGVYYNYYYSENRPNLQSGVVSTRNFFKQFKVKKGDKLEAGYLDIAPPIITYGLKNEIKVSSTPSEINKESSDITQVVAQCDVQTIYDDQKNVFEIAISYSKIEKSKKDSVILQESEMNDAKENIEKLKQGEDEYERDLGEQVVKQQQDLFYLATVVSDSGELISLQSEKSEDEDKVVTWMTQQLINDIFPELRDHSYKVPNIEEDNLGKVSVDYTKNQLDSNTIVINKEYNSKDYTQVNLEKITLPNIEYDRNTILKQDTGITVEGKSVYQFDVGQSEGNKLQAGESRTEMLGNVKGHVKQQFWIIDNTQQDTLKIAKEMWRYRHEANFVKTKLSIEDKGDIELGNGNEIKIDLVPFDEPTEVIEVEEGELKQSQYLQEGAEKIEEDINEDDNKKNGEKITLLRSERPVLQKVHTLASIHVLGNRIHVDSDYFRYIERSNLYIDAKVNGHLISRLVSFDWRNCESQFEEHGRSYDVTLFRATFPLYGIIVVPIQAQARFTVMIQKQIQNYPGYCNYILKPYIKGALYADGQASIAGIISAGIYAEGNFLDTSLTLNAQSVYGKTFITLDGYFHEFGLNIGITYTKISCSFKNIFHRNLKERRNLSFFKKIRRVVTRTVRVGVHVANTIQKIQRYIPSKIETICSFHKGYHQIYSKQSPTYHSQLWHQEFPFGL